MARDEHRFQYPCAGCYRLTFDHCRVCVNCNYAEQLGQARCLDCFARLTGAAPQEHRLLTHRLPVLRPHEALSLLHFLTVHERALRAAARAETAAAALKASRRLVWEALALNAAAG